MTVKVIEVITRNNVVLEICQSDGEQPDRPFFCRLRLEDAESDTGRSLMLNLPEVSDVKSALEAAKHCLDTIMAFEIGDDTKNYITDTSGWTEEQLSKKISQLHELIKLQDTEGSAGPWWADFEEENAHRKSLIIRLQEEILLRNATAQEFFLAYVYSHCDNMQGNLHFLDYKQLKKKEENQDPAEFRNLAVDAVDWSEEDIFPAEDLESISIQARRWWHHQLDFYAKTPSLLAIFCRELRERKVSPEEAFMAAVYADSESLPAIISYIDYLQFFREEPSKKKVMSDPILSFRLASKLGSLCEIVMMLKALSLDDLDQEGENDNGPFFEPIPGLLGTPRPYEFDLMRCEKCSTPLFPEEHCRTCAGELKQDPEIEIEFQQEIDDWILALEVFPGQMSGKYFAQLFIKELAPLFEKAIKGYYAFDGASLALRLSKGMDYMIHEKELSAYIISYLPKVETLGFAKGEIWAKILDSFDPEFELMERLFGLTFLSQEKEEKDS